MKVSRFLQASSRRLQLNALDWSRPKDPPMSLGQASILTNLKHHNIDVIEKSWNVNVTSFDPTEVIDTIMSPSVNNIDSDVAFGVFIWNEQYIQTILQNLQKYHFKGRVILGGPQISYADAQTLEKFYPSADIFIRGYAESAMVDLVNASTPTAIQAIKGVHIANSTDLHESAQIALQSLPSPFLSGVIQPQPFIRWETQRGCQFQCSFCQHREPNNGIDPKKRSLDTQRINSEIQWILSNPIIQDIAVLDPVFNRGSNYLNYLKDLIGYTGKLALQCRIELVNDAFLDTIVQINKTGRVVLEFGLQTIHEHEMLVINRKNNLTKAQRILKQCSDLGIECEMSLIFGLPTQTVKSFQESVDFCKNQNVKTIHAFPLMLLRGTPMEKNKARYNLMESNEIASLSIPRVQKDIPHVVSGESFNYANWLEMAKIAAELETDYNKRT